MTNTFLRNDGQFKQVAGGDIGLSTTTTTGFLTYLSNYLASPVTIGSSSVFVVGPTVSQGSSGTWFASGTVTVTEGAANGTVYLQLWDGTTVISASAVTPPATGIFSVTLSGIIAAPAGNLNIAGLVATVNATFQSSTALSTNASGITAIRIG